MAYPTDRSCQLHKSEGVKIWNGYDGVLYCTKESWTQANVVPRMVTHSRTHRQRALDDQPTSIDMQKLNHLTYSYLWDACYVTTNLLSSEFDGDHARNNIRLCLAFLSAVVDVVSNVQVPLMNWLVACPTSSGEFLQKTTKQSVWWLQLRVCS